MRFSHQLLANAWGNCEVNHSLARRAWCLNFFNTAQNTWDYSTGLQASVTTNDECSIRQSFAEIIVAQIKMTQTDRNGVRDIGWLWDIR